MKKHYVAGLLFSENKDLVALVHKIKGPPPVVGKWNAIGGKVEPNETPFHAMVREFNEETGVVVESWSKFLTLTSDTWVVHFYVSYNTIALLHTRTMEEEKISIHVVDDRLMIFPEHYVSNLSWIVPMALTFRDQNVDAYHVVEHNHAGPDCCAPLGEPQGPAGTKGVA